MLFNVKLLFKVSVNFFEFFKHFGFQMYFYCNDECVENVPSEYILKRDVSGARLLEHNPSSERKNPQGCIINK